MSQPRQPYRPSYGPNSRPGPAPTVPAPPPPEVPAAPWNQQQYPAQQHPPQQYPMQQRYPVPGQAGSHPPAQQPAEQPAPPAGTEGEAPKESNLRGLSQLMAAGGMAAMIPWRWTGAFRWLAFLGLLLLVAAVIVWIVAFVSAKSGERRY